MRALVVASATLLLAACSSGGGHGAGPSIPAHPTSGAKADRAFLSVERSQFPSAITNKLLVGLAHGTCADFGRGVDWTTEVASMIRVGGMPAKVAGGFIAAAVGTYCPARASVLPGH